MITFSKAIEALEMRKGLFFRGPQSRKPYKVTVFEIKEVFMKARRYCRELSSEKLKTINPLDVEGANIAIVFTNGDTEVVSICFLFTSWKDAAEVSPIRDPRCSCGDPDCKNWQHWFQMSDAAKKLMLAANPGYDKTDLGGGVVLNRPHIIPGGWGYWEAMARQQQQSGNTNGEQVTC